MDNKLIDKNSKRKVPVSKILFYCLIYLILVLIILKWVSLHSEWNINKKSVKTKQKSTNFSREQTGHRSMAPLLKSNCIPTNVTRTYNNNYPDAFDWRSKGVVGDVIDQLSCTVCWSISIIGVMESMVAIGQLARGTFHGVITLSIQEMIDCAYRRGCIMGDPRSALEDMMQRNMSIVTQKEYPLTFREEACKIPQNVHPKGVMIGSFRVDCYISSKQMMSLIYNHGPVVVTVNASPWMLYTDGIITRNCPNLVRSNHIVQIVGYDNSGAIPYYIVKNSWGPDFGIDGYVKVKMGDNLCGIEDYVVAIDVRT